MLPGSRFSSGTTTSSRKRAPVADARNENFFSISGAAKPRVPLSTMNPRMPSSVCAQTIARSAIGAFVIHIFAPFSTQSLPRRFAWVFMLTGSEPPCGSVRPKQPISSPVAMRGRYFWRCASLPNAWIGYMHRLDCTDTKLRIPESPRSSSWQMRP